MGFDVCKGLPQIETPRLILRPFRLSDSEDVFAYASDLMVTQWTLWEAHADGNASRLRVQSVVERYTVAPYFCWAIEDKRQRTVIGSCGFDDHWHRKSHRARYAYVLSRDFWGQGIEWEAGQEILRFGFTDLELHRVTGRCLRDDTQAERIYQRLGLTYEGMLWDHVWSKGQFRTVKYYGLLAPEYFARVDMMRKRSAFE
ncbi:GNAT family N-acetyltransferase [Sulfobacillus sp. hq2]|uniref:GNAT family N-acetyltransferase n=1 Tax=Sulfobacillus TaxID=28033 RepID=UPI000CD02B5C|nr:GNAT family protein [Sulfobacillus sp. hq2]POB09077.1 hypothetical protein CO251_16000 [Sulfobacillus sp. hq2]